MDGRGATMTSRTGATTSAAEPPPRPCAPAFTLIELILVMALLVIVIATVAPSLSGFFHGRNLDSEARRFLGLTRYGQSRAVSEGTPMRLWIDVNRHTYGLQAEYGGSLVDSSAKVFVLDPELLVEVLRSSRVRTTRSPSSTQSGQAYDGSSTAVSLRFLPDGGIDETSPDQIRIYEDPARRPPTTGRENRGQNEVWITTDLYRLKYEIATNLPALSRR